MRHDRRSASVCPGDTGEHPETRCCLSAAVRTSESMRTRLLTIDGVFNLLLGVVLVWYPLSVAEALGLPASGRPFFASVLGGVLFGIGVSLLIERLRRRTGIGLGLGGALAINLCGAVVLVAWLLGSSLALTVLGRFLLWTLAALLVGLSLIELYVQVRCPRR